VDKRQMEREEIQTDKREEKKVKKIGKDLQMGRETEKKGTRRISEG
jgi:hypothetical protein